MLPIRRGVACAVQACGQAAHGYRDAELCEGRGGLSRSHHRQPPEPVSVFAHVRLEGLDGLGPSPGIFLHDRLCTAELSVSHKLFVPRLACRPRVLGDQAPERLSSEHVDSRSWLVGPLVDY